jgi:hypothetical protein
VRILFLRKGNHREAWFYPTDRKLVGEGKTEQPTSFSRRGGGQRQKRRNCGL